MAEGFTEKANGYLELRAIRKSFGKEEVVKGLDLSIPRGECLVILGPSGCGKSTSLRIISGLIDQDAGEVWLDGRCIDPLPPNKRNVGFVFQHYSLFPHLSARRNIEFGMGLRGVPRAKREAKSAELLSLIGMEKYGDKKPRHLSGGQQQRVALARALAVEPTLLLLDEPFGALDYRIRKRIRADVRKLLKQLGITTIFVTHDQEEAFEFGDRIAVMNAGLVEQVGSARELYESPRTPFVTRFIGNVNVIRLPGKLEQPDMDVMVRPEDISLELMQEGGQARVSAVVQSVSFLGTHYEVAATLDNGETMACDIPKVEFDGSGIVPGVRVKVKIRRFHYFEGDGKGSVSVGL